MNTHSSHVHTTFSQLEHILDVQKKSQMDLEGIILSEVNQTEEDQKKKKKPDRVTCHGVLIVQHLLSTLKMYEDSHNKYKLEIVDAIQRKFNSLYLYSLNSNTASAWCIFVCCCSNPIFSTPCHTE